MKLSLLLFSLLACTLTTEPIYLTGDATYSIVSGPTDTVRVQHEAENVVVFPGESLCVHFQADGRIETFFLSSNYLGVTWFSWLPAKRYPGVLFAISGYSVFTSVDAKRC